MKERLAKLFGWVLGDEYKIAHVSEAEEDVERESDGEAEEEIKKDDCRAKVVFNYSGDETQAAETAKLSREILELLEKDQRQSDYFKHRVQSRAGEEQAQAIEPKRDAQTEKIILEAQEFYDRTISAIDGKINALKEAKVRRTEEYLDIVANNDQNDPYRNQLAENANPVYLKEQIESYEILRKDPFYGFLRIRDERGNVREWYIGKKVIKEGDVEVISAWSDLGKAFRHNLSKFRYHGTRYVVLNKYTFRTVGDKIVDAKDDSPR